MAGITVKINTTGIRNRIKRYQTDVKAKLQAEWPTIAAECLNDIQSRAPSPEEEYYYLMGLNSMSGLRSVIKNKGFLASSGMLYGRKFRHHSELTSPDVWKGGRTHRIGIENPGSGSYFGPRSYLIKPKQGGQFKMNFKGGTRIPFIREPGRYLKELIVDPTTYRIDSTRMKMAFGVWAALDAGSRYSWQNFSARQGTSIHLSNYGVWKWFEYGFSARVVPRQYPGSNTYPLRPNATDAFWWMNKKYPRFRMYSGFNRAVFLNAVNAVARTVTF